MIAVFNSSPLIFLSGIDIIDKALDLFSEVFVPSQVQAEIMAKEDVASEKLASLTASKRVIIVQAKNTRMVDAICRRLGKGESEAIVTAIEVTADMVVLDDRAARIEAMSLGLNVKGTLGIIKKLRRSPVLGLRLPTSDLWFLPECQEEPQIQNIPIEDTRNA